MSAKKELNSNVPSSALELVSYVQETMQNFNKYIYMTETSSQATFSLCPPFTFFFGDLLFTEASSTVHLGLNIT